MAYLEETLREFWPAWLLKPFGRLMRTVRWIVLWLERDPRWRYRGHRPPGTNGGEAEDSGDRAPLIPRGPRLSGTAAKQLPRRGPES